MIIIPIEDAAHQSLLIALGERRVRLSVWWQPSDAAWYLSVDTASGEGIARGRRLTADGVAVTAQGFGSIRMDGPSDPTRAAWRDGTHRLIWAAE